MKKILLFPVMLTLTFYSCHKKEKPTPTPDNRQYSYWTVNEDSFSTKEVIVDIGHVFTRIRSNSDADNYFRMQFKLTYLPEYGSFHLTTYETSDPANAEISFYYNGIFYVISPTENSSLEASLVNNKSQFKLDTTWFLNYYDDTDSVSIRGEFNEP
jgi:hypothetical protein